MSERTGGPFAALSKPRLYEALQRLVGSADSHPRFVREILRPRPGERMLDIGCGPGRIVEHLPEMTYLGFDLNPDYIEAARRDFGDRPGFEFRCLDVRDAELEPGSFDLVSVMGVVHHLDDEAAEALFALAARALGGPGRLVSIEPAFRDGQNPVARWLIGRDRGASVRSPRGYADLAERSFAEVETKVREDLLRIPYTHAVIEASGSPDGTG